MPQGIFLPESTLSADSLTVSVNPGCAIAYINICVHVKDPVVYVRVRWIMDALKKILACNVGWEVRLCRSWLSPGKATRIPMREIPMGQYSVWVVVFNVTAAWLGDSFSR